MTNNLLNAGAHSIEVSGVEQHYHIAGKGPFCVVHSGGPGVAWDYLRMPLLEAFFTMIYVEPIGSGSSGRLPGHPLGYTVSRYSDQLHELIKALGLNRPVLLGHSHGGFVAQHYTLSHPHQLSALILYATSPVTGSGFMTEADRLFRGFAENHPDRIEARSALLAWESVANMRNDEDYTSVMKALLPIYFRSEPRLTEIYEAAREKMRASLVMGDDKPFDSRERLDELDLPVLILVGALDFICGPRWAEALHNRIAGSHLVCFDGCGHFPHLEQAVPFANEVERFVREIDLK